MSELDLQRTIDQEINQVNSPKQMPVWVAVLLIIAASCLSGLAVYFWQNNPQPQLDSQQTTINTSGIENQLNGQNSAPTTTLENPTGSKLISVDDAWNLYTNYDLGFSIKVPKLMAHGYGKMCSWEVDSYRPVEGNVPTKIFEDLNNSQVYLSSEFFYTMGDEKIVDGLHYYGTCDKTVNSLDQLKDKDNFRQMYWKIQVAKDVKNQQELTQLIKDHYGTGCQIGEQKPSTQVGAYEVSILGDGKDLSESKCPINYAYTIKYNPEKNIVVFWNMGQYVAFNIISEVNGSKIWSGYDTDMVDSFRFE